LAGVHSVANLDRYVAGESIVHRADPTAKLIVTLTFIFALTSLPPGSWWAIGAFAGLAWTAVVVSGVGVTRVLKATLIIAPFLLVPVPSMFTRPGAEVFALDLGWFMLTATDDGIVFVASIVAKSWTAVSAAALLTFTTPFMAIVNALHRLHVPAILVAIVSLMYRYMFLLADEVQRVLRARAARSARAEGHRSGGSISWRAKATGGMAGSLFVRTAERSERVYLAMAARGYNGVPPNAMARDTVPGFHGLATATAAVVFVAIAVSARLVGL
jgi:cobalt/nickel transport system permease protein